MPVKNSLGHGFRVLALVAACLILLLGGRSETVASAEPQSANPQVIQPEPVGQFTRLTPADGLSFPAVTAVLQDSRGYLWIATAGGGLNRYDGYNFTVYRKNVGDDASLPFDDVGTLYEDSDGTLWVGGAGGLARFDQVSGAFGEIDGRGQVFTIAEDRRGLLWVGFWHGLYAYDRASGELIQAYEHDRWDRDESGQLSEGNVRVVLEDASGELWIGTSGGLERFDRATGEFDHYRHDTEDPTSLSHNNVLSIYEDRQRRLWVGTAGGLNLMDRATGSFSHFQHDPLDPASLSDNVIRFILEDSQGMIWLATHKGLNRLDMIADEARFVHYRHDPLDLHSLSHDEVYTLFEDRSGVVWAGTSYGLSKYNRLAGQFARYQVNVDGLSESGADTILTFHEDRQGVLWLGGAEGGLYRLDPHSGALAVFRRDWASPGDNAVWAILEDRDGVLWVGTGSGRLSRFDRETEAFIAAWRVHGVGVSHLAEDGQGNLWVGTTGDGLYRLDAERSRLVHYPHHWTMPDHWRQFGSLSSHIVESLYIDHEQQLWVGTYAGGINIWDAAADRFEHYRRDPGNPNSLGHDRVLSFCDDPFAAGEVMWVGTMGGGLNRLDQAEQTFTRYVEADGLLGDTVGCIMADSAGYLWLSTIRGLSRFDPRTERFVHYGQEDGVPIANPACLQRSSGEMLFSTVGGFFSFHPEALVDNPQPPPVVITGFSLHNQPSTGGLTDQEQLHLSYQDNFIAFEFAALDFTSPEKNRYAYMLEGLEDTWVDAGARRRVEYTNLPPGEYTFRVKGSNNDGIWNETGATIFITIEPPFWQRWWFRGAILLILATFTFTGYRLRVRGLETRGRLLEAQVAERTAELVRANEYLEIEIEERTRAEEELAKERASAAVAVERSRLARELHDAVTQTLFSASLIAEATPKVWEKDPEAGLRQLEEVRLLNRGALAEMRSLLLALRPEAITLAEMGDLLAQLGRAATGRCGVSVTVNAIEESKLPAGTQMAFYRIAQEALNNVAKHADATRVTVDYTAEGGRAELVIADNGRGFVAGDVPADCFGHQIMNERAVSIGADLVITSRIGEGTTVTLRWPGPGEEEQHA